MSARTWTAMRVATIATVAALGCSRDAAPAAQATTPGFESEVPATAAAVVREEDVCRALEGARFQLDEVSDGVRITITPTARASLPSIQRAAAEVDRALSRPDNVLVAGDTCKLAELARNGGSATVDSTAEGVTIRITARGDDDTQSLQEASRDFVGELED